MKKVITFIIILTLAFAIFAVPASAAGSATEAATDIINAVLNRVFEWWEANKAEILAACSGLGAAISGAIVWYKSKKPFISLITSAKTTDERENALIKGYNEMVDAVKAHTEEVKAFRTELAEVKGYVINTEDIEAHIAKVLSTVYTNSIALPQGVKNMINVECAQAMTVANRDLGVEVISYDTTDEGDID